MGSLTYVVQLVMGLSSSAVSTASSVSTPFPRFLPVLFILFAFSMPSVLGVDGDPPPVPISPWTPGRHIAPLDESGHPSIMDPTFGAPYWRGLRPAELINLSSP